MGSDREILFAKTLEAVRKTAKEQNNSIAREQVEEAFAKMALEKEQLEMVFDYLKQHHIGIGESADPEEALTAEDVNYLELYLEELQALEQISEGQREAVTLSAMAGDQSAKKKLIEIYLPRVVEVAKLYAGQGVLMEDLIGEGNVALTLGVEMLGCLEHQSEVQGLLGKMMMDAMEEYIADSAQEDETDREILKRVNEVNDKARELAESLLRKVTPEELAAETGMQAEEIRAVMQMSGKTMEYLEAGE